MHILTNVISTQAKGAFLAIQIRYTVFVFGKTKGDCRYFIKILTPSCLFRFDNNRSKR